MKVRRFFWFCLCANLCVLGVSAVTYLNKGNHRRDAKKRREFAKS